MLTKKYLSLEELINKYDYKPQIGETFSFHHKFEITLTGFKKIIIGCTSLRGVEAIKSGYDENGNKYSDIALIKINTTTNINGECTLNSLFKYVNIETKIIINN